MNMEWKFFVYEGTAFFVNYEDNDAVLDMTELTYVNGSGRDLFDALRNHLLGNY